MAKIPKILSLTRATLMLLVIDWIKHIRIQPDMAIDRKKNILLIFFLGLFASARMPKLA